MSSIAYDKGASFLRTIDRAVGRQCFDQWLRGYFDRNAFQTITSALFLADLRQHLTQRDEALEERLRCDESVSHPALPPHALLVRRERFRAVDQGAQSLALRPPRAPREL